MWTFLGKVSMKVSDVATWVPSDQTDPAWGKFQFNKELGGDSFTWLNYLYKYLEPVLWAIMAIVGAAGAIYAIVLGVNLARAEDQSKRDEAKKRLVTTLIAVGVTIALVIFFNTLLPMIIAAFSGKTIKVTGTP